MNFPQEGQGHTILPNEARKKSKTGDTEFGEQMSQLAKELGVSIDEIIKAYDDAKREAENANPEEWEALSKSKIIKILIIEIVKAKITAQKYRLIAQQDKLTGLGTRAALEQEKEKRKENKGNKSSVIMIDIDHFKKINDTYGHHAGDFILSETATVIRDTARTEDKIFRYGGEEIIILADGSKDDVVLFAERLRKIIEDTKFVYKDPTTQEEKTIPVTFSAGVSDSGDTLEQIIRNADKSLYEAKQAGRNKVVSSN